MAPWCHGGNCSGLRTFLQCNSFEWRTELILFVMAPLARHAQGQRNERENVKTKNSIAMMLRDDLSTGIRGRLRWAGTTKSTRPTMLPLLWRCVLASLLEGWSFGPSVRPCLLTWFKECWLKTHFWYGVLMPDRAFTLEYSGVRGITA